MSNSILKKNCRIRLKIKDTGEVFIGTFCGGSVGVIEINNVVDQKGKQLLGVYSFNLDEIEKLQQNISQDQKRDETSKVSDGRLYSYMLPMEEIERLQEVAECAPLISSEDSTYQKAVDTLKMTETIGLSVLGHNNMALLILELAEILQSKIHQKVVHGEEHAQYLKKINIELNNVYDTQKWELLIYNKFSHQTMLVGRCLDEAMQDVLKIPDYVLYKAIEKNSEMEKWSQRPLSDSRRLCAALLCVFLCPLKDGLEFEKCKPVIDSTCDIYNFYIEQDNINFDSIIRNNECCEQVIRIIKKNNFKF
ncbi:uncharacterized protein LOC109598803 [Aethina tumida]|uniref:uncharacterized protein LOC109598803 n=1 Tax=Aethina tumida TaxID=116153 RepID=UPI002149632F|nr:uncharacterized protein LOC109598803 [Aethina tumida]